MRYSCYNEKMETKDIIVDTATKLFYQLGYNKTTLRKIAESCGYSHTALFTYFKNKGEIAKALQINYLDVLVAHTESFLKSHQNPESDPLMAFFYYWYVHFSFLKRDRHFANFYFEYYETAGFQFVEVALTKGKKITQDLFKFQLSPSSEWEDLLNYEMITAMDMIIANHYFQEKITIDHALTYLYHFFHYNNYIQPASTSRDTDDYIQRIKKISLPIEQITKELFL